MRPGTYRLFLLVASANLGKPKQEVIEIELTGSWHEGQTEMLKNGIKLRLIDLQPENRIKMYERLFRTNLGKLCQPYYRTLINYWAGLLRRT